MVSVYPKRIWSTAVAIDTAGEIVIHLGTGTHIQVGERLVLMDGIPVMPVEDSRLAIVPVTPEVDKHPVVVSRELLVVAGTIDAGRRAEVEITTVTEMALILLLGHLHILHLGWTAHRHRR